jgi:hypothetical protein
MRAPLCRTHSLRPALPDLVRGERCRCEREEKGLEAEGDRDDEVSVHRRDL